MQVQLEVEDVESVPEFRELIHQLCQEEPAVAQAIATAIRENIPGLSPRSPSKRKQRQDPSYRPSHAVQSAPRKKRCTASQSALDEPMTPESPMLESEIPEIEETLRSTVCLDTDELRPVPTYGSRPDIYLTTLAIDEENIAKSDCNTMSVSNTRQRTESPSMPEQHPFESMSSLDTVHQMVDIVHLLNRYQTDLPRTVHRRILQSLYTT